MTDVVDIVDGLDLVVGLADGHLHPDDLEAARRAARSARDRAGHLGATLVTALLGGTGVGKSSLLNALAGEHVASTSPVRPHTTEPLAWIPSGAEPALATLLDDLEITRRVVQSRVPGMAILDMTDVDSVEAGHRSFHRNHRGPDLRLDPIRVEHLPGAQPERAPGGSRDRPDHVLDGTQSLLETAHRGALGRQ